jgi:hypothetical protein
MDYVEQAMCLRKTLFGMSEETSLTLVLRSWVVGSATVLVCCAAEMQGTQPKSNDTGSETTSDETSFDAKAPPALKLSAAAQTLLTQLLEQTHQTATHVVKNADPQEATAVYSLLGVNAGQGSDAHLAMPCTGERPPSAPTCGTDFPRSMPFLGQFNTCFTQGCLGAQQSYVDVYVTSASNRSAAVRSQISYPTMAPYPPGTVTYDPNPLVRWQTDTTDLAAIHVKAELNENVKVALEDAPSLDLSYHGVVEAVLINGKHRLRIDLTLPHLIPSQAVSVSLKQDEDMSVAGEIAAGGMTLADLSDVGISWRK